MGRWVVGPDARRSGVSFLMSYVPIEELDFFKDLEVICDEIWFGVAEWSPFAQRTGGEQLVRALDSMAANAAEGDGRHSDKESLHFFSIAKSSGREARFWIVRATRRRLLDTDNGEALILRLESVMRRFNALIRHRRSRPDTVKEQPASYLVEDEDHWSDDCLH